MVDDSDPVPLLVEQAVKAALNHNLQEARQALNEINYYDLIQQRQNSKLAVQFLKKQTPTWRQNAIRNVSRISVPPSRQKAIFIRDNFTCRYTHCGKQTIHLPVLKALSSLFPDIIRYHSNWKPVEDHALHWTYSTSLEHIVSFPSGGTSDESNLITACYQCNDVKKDVPLSVLGWSVAEPVSSEWKGLSEYLPDLFGILQVG